MSDHIGAIEMPDIEGCPDCGSVNLAGLTYTVEGTMISLDGDGGVAHWEPNMLYRTLVRELDCNECGANLIDAGEIVHKGVNHE